MSKVTIIVESNDGEPRPGDVDKLYKAAKELCFDEEDIQTVSGVKDAKIYIVPGDD